MRRSDIHKLDPSHAWWVLAVEALERNWPGAPGCRRGARYLIDPEAMRACRDEFGAFDSRLSCLEWLARHRRALNRKLPGGAIRPVRLDRWLLGME